MDQTHLKPVWGIWQISANSGFALGEILCLTALTAVAGKASSWSTEKTNVQLLIFSEPPWVTSDEGSGTSESFAPIFADHPARLRVNAMNHNMLKVPAVVPTFTHLIDPLFQAILNLYPYLPNPLEITGLWAATGFEFNPSKRKGQGRKHRVFNILVVSWFWNRIGPVPNP